MVTHPLRESIEQSLAPARFVSDSPLSLRADHERIRWELYQGRLLDESLTREEKSFFTWTLESGEEPILSLKLDEEAGELHLVRHVESYVHQGYDSGGGIYLTREVRRRALELIATFRIAESDNLVEEVPLAIARAITGTRLPLTPAESPLPTFSFGRLWYRHETTDPSRDFEFDLRSRSVEDVAARWADRSADELLAILRQTFLDVSLSPYTHFVDHVLLLLALFEQRRVLSSEAVLDFEAWLLRLVARHLTAYDLVVFHHRGANYPDALLLDAVLTNYLTRLERQPDLFASIARRSALRQAYCLRRRYENHPVPDVPTSPGERARVYPADHPRVPEEQIVQTNQRRKFLFAESPLTERLTNVSREALQQSIVDLRLDAQYRELGAALYLDRPFGGGLGPVSGDATPLFASLAHSRSIATQRLRLLEADLGLSQRELPLQSGGIPIRAIGGPVRPGTVSLADAARCAIDFVFLHTTRGSTRRLTQLFDFESFADRLTGQILLARSPRGPGVIVYDSHWQARLEFEPILDRGYLSRRGIDLPADGLRLTHVEGEPLVEPITLPLRRTAS